MALIPLSERNRSGEHEPVQQPMARSLASNVRRGAIWNVASTLLLKFSSIGITALVARILTPHDFGVFAVATTVFTIVSAFAEFGVTSCLARADLRVRDLAPTLWSISFGSSVIIAILLVCYAQPIAFALGAADGAGPVRIMAIVTILTGVIAVPTAQCVRDFKQDRIFLANVIAFFPSTIVLVILAKTGSGATAFAWSRVIGQLTSCIIILIATPRFYGFRISGYALSILWKFGLPLAVANFVGYLLQNVDYALIGHLLGPVELGTYVIAFNSASWSSSLLLNVLTTVAMPAFSRVTNNREKLMLAMADGVRAVILIAAPMCTLVMVLARPIVLTLYGAHWAAAANPLRILSLYGFISIICMLFASMLAALGRSRFILAVQLVWLVALVPAMTIGVRRDGIVGAASAHIVIIVPIVLPCYLFALKRASGVKLMSLVKTSLPPIIAALAAAVITCLTIELLHSPLGQLLLGGTVGGLFYLAVMLPQIIAILGRGKIRNEKAQRVLGKYYNFQRSMGLRIGPPPRHAATGRRSVARRPSWK
jgi:lipopolysaccharide exporter